MHIRLAKPDDAGQLAAIYRPAVIERATSFELIPPDAAEMAERVTRTLRRTPWLVAEERSDGDGAGEVIGYAYASGHRDRAAYQWSVDVSAYVAERAHRRGVGRALYTVLFDVLRLQGYRNAYAGITLPNEASEGLHRATGFETVGVYRKVGYKFGVWHDTLWLALALGEHIVEPSAPRPLPEMLAEVEALLAARHTGH